MRGSGEVGYGESSSGESSSGESSSGAAERADLVPDSEREHAMALDAIDVMSAMDSQLRRTMSNGRAMSDGRAGRRTGAAARAVQSL